MLRTDQPTCVKLGGEKILLVHDGEAVRAYSAICPHAGAPLEEGAICDGRIVCPWHKASFRISDGALLEPPALNGLARYDVRIEGQDILVGEALKPAAIARPKTDERSFVIVGAGAAGAAAAAALREFGFAGRIALIGRESGLPFDRTSLSKFVLSGEMKPEEAPLLKPETFYADQKIDRVHGDISLFDARRRTLELTDGRKFIFDRALVASGGEPKPLSVEGASLEGVHMLRSRDDAAAILANLRPGARAIVLGASFIGLEVAACLRAQRVSVTVASPEEIPFARQFGERIGKSLRTLHESNGVIFESRTKPAKLEGSGRVSAVALEDGRRLAADLVIVGVGVRPATNFIKGMELTKDGGLSVDTTMRAAESVYAAGDIAAFPIPPEGRRARIEHWRVAQIQARVAAQNMLGGGAVYDAPPFFWTYHYGKTIEYLGHADGWDDEVVLGDVDKLSFAAFLLKGERVVAVVACERQRLMAVLAQRMRAPLDKGRALELAHSMY